MKVSAIVLTAMLGFTLNAAAQTPSKNPQDKPKTNTRVPKEKKPEKKPKAKTDASRVDKNPRRHDPDYCPACGMG